LAGIAPLFGEPHTTELGLDRDRLQEGRDLALTTDSRDVVAEVVSGHYGTRGRLNASSPATDMDPKSNRGLKQT